MKKINYCLFAYLLVGFSYLTFGQSEKTETNQTHLQTYISEGLAQNESIKEQNFILEKNIAALNEAKSLFYPNVDFNTNYFLAGGGRTIDFPLGDLFNPVYATLNQLTQSQSFPQLENQNILLNPDNFYDVRFRISAPLLNAEIAYNKKIKSAQIPLQEIEIKLYKRELVKDIKIAYFNYLKAQKAIEIYESVLKLVKENQRVNQSLLDNGKILRTAVVRSDNEVTKFQSRIEVAKQEANSAKAYFNFLLNKEANEEILVDNFDIPTQEILRNTDTEQREEIQKLAQAKVINEQVIGLSKAYKTPQIGAFLDLGSQGFDFDVNDKTAYYLFGLSLQWKVFSAGKNKYKVKQAQMDNQILDTKTSYIKDQLNLQLITSINSFNASLSNYRALQQQEQASTIYYSDIQKLYTEGQALFIEVLDAQNQLTTAQLELNIALFDTWIKATQIERATASFDLD